MEAMRGIVYSLVFKACVAIFAALLLLSFNGCGEVDGEAVMPEIHAEEVQHYCGNRFGELGEFGFHGYCRH